MTNIGICLGDVTGIGPEVTLKAVAAELAADNIHYVLIGDETRIRRLDAILGTRLPFSSWQAHAGRPVSPTPPSSSTHSGGAVSPKPPSPNHPRDPAPPHGEGLPQSRVSILQPLADPLPDDLRPGAPEAALAAVAWLKAGTEHCLRGELHALVTAPVNKEAIVNAGVSFIGQTELLSELSGTTRTAMMLLGQDRDGRWLRVALATTHVPIKDLAARITGEKVELAIELAAQACRDLGLPRARVGVCGLNPHAGEGGKMGTEEITTITPAVNAARSRGLDAVGPLSADALFYYAYNGDYDAVVAMYHDQGLAPLKMVAFEQGINWTLGLPFIRTSPDHGTAYDIAGRGCANASSMIAALRLARQLAGAKSA